MEEREVRDGQRLAKSAAPMVVNLVPHTLDPVCATGGSHHLVLEKSGVARFDKKTRMYRTRFKGVCKLCGGVDTWTTGEPLTPSHWAKGGVSGG